MARKLLGDLDNESDEPNTPAGTTSPSRAPRRSSLVTGGAAAPRYVEGSARSKADRTYQDIQIDQIQDSQIEDRIDINEDLDQLVASIQANGQQIPVIVRIVNKDRPYEIVAGRRRIAALRKLGKTTVKGFITRMTDKEAFVAQGIENSARLETSFIERARTIAKAYAHGFDQIEAAEFFGISQTLVNFMSRIYDAIGEDLVLAIGPARGVGRRKWEKLILLAKDRNLSSSELIDMVDDAEPDSVARFEALLKSVEGLARAGKAPAKPVTSGRREFLDGKYVMTQKPGQLVIKADRSASDDLLTYISGRVDEIIAEFTDMEGRKTDTQT